MHGNTYLLGLGYSEDLWDAFGTFCFTFFSPDDSRHHCCCLSFLSDLWVFDDTFFLSRVGR